MSLFLYPFRITVENIDVTEPIEWLVKNIGASSSKKREVKNHFEDISEDVSKWSVKSNRNNRHRFYFKTEKDLFWFKMVWA